MRILFLAGRDPKHPHAGGGDEQGWRWARWAAEEGHEVVFVCQSVAGAPDDEVVGGVRVLRLGRGAALAARTLLWMRRQPPFDVVYEDPIGGGRTPYFSPLHARAPVIAVWHQVSADLLKALHTAPVAWLLSTIERVVARIYRRALLWVPSEERATEVRDALGFREGRVTVLPPTIDPELLTSPTTKAVGPTFLFLGVIRPYKNVHHLLEALRLLRASKSVDARVVVAGRRLDAGYADRLVALAEHLGIRSSVEFRFGVSEPEKLELLDSCRALVLPSVVEGFGIVTIEAHARGVPVIASEGVPMSAVRDGQDGLRFPVGDVTALAGAMASMLDPERHAHMAMKARDAAESYVTCAVAPRFGDLLWRSVSEHEVPIGSA